MFANAILISCLNKFKSMFVSEELVFYSLSRCQNQLYRGLVIENHGKNDLYLNKPLLQSLRAALIQYKMKFTKCAAQAITF